ncbi:hypothetical protein EHQ68_08900 [Leptospira congkakensis]|uniref:DUF2029 domain-containing protein n=1 Tax=Leptospira congkakensis TaxID=2484932 RepID=A0A4Z1A425_9LEPT|nr:hypothetical protein [Leptospira congkakensis]TGL88745.1 hypothetical protein EHQ69_14970 [Leptospira congkakensis]TGL89331.1 hypothetical protein EHQ68_08900 [Leptospira congkakensis]TGL97300.1 hypothetical protein EHQ70_08395 [Leptospira congkakensis]
MDQSKKAIGFFVSLAFLVLGFLIITTKQIEPSSDFALIEWQVKLVGKGIFHLPYDYSLQDPKFQLVPFPEVFFHTKDNFIYSTFPNFYPILVFPFYMSLGTMGIKLIQLLLFFLSAFVFYQIKKDTVATILLLFGSTISVYIFLVHDTILFLFLEVVILFLYHRKWTIVSGFLSLCLVWMRPEMLFTALILPICFSKEINWKQYFLTFFATGFVFSIINQIIFGTFIPLRIFKAPQYHFRIDSSFYLFKIWLEQVPIFILSVIYCIRFFFHKKILYQNIFLILITLFMILISPNTGGHNTPRYLFGLFPLYILLLRKNEENETTISKKWFFICLLLSLYSLTVLFQQTKEIKKISKFQSNTLEELSKIEDKILVFNNADFAFVVLPLLDQKKDILLLRNSDSTETFFQILNAKNTKSFTFLELPPSPFPIGEIITQPRCLKDCSFQKGETKPVPNTLLPIMATQYKRM